MTTEDQSISGQVSLAEELPPVEMATDAAAAAATAGEALLAVQAQEVSTLAEVLTRLNEKEASLGLLVGRLESGVTAIETMKAEIQESLAAIRAQREAAEAQPATTTKTTGTNQATGLRRLMP